MSYKTYEVKVYDNSNGNEEWHLNGKLHRENGPAYKCIDGTEKWFLNDIEYTEEEYNKKQNNVLSCAG